MHTRLVALVTVLDLEEAPVTRLRPCSRLANLAARREADRLRRAGHVVSTYTSGLGVVQVFDEGSGASGKLLATCEGWTDEDQRGAAGEKKSRRTASGARHPMQPVVVDSSGIHRFKQNAIVLYMLDAGTRAKVFDLNTLAMHLPKFSREDHEQLAQLIGYSVSGACDLSYMSDAVCNAALAESNRLVLAAAARSNPKSAKKAKERR